MIKLILTPLFILVFLPFSLHAIDEITNLQKLELEITEQESDLRRIGLKKAKLQENLKEVNERIKDLEINRKNLNLKLDQVKTKLKEIIEELDVLARKQDQLKEYANLRFYKLYKMWRHSRSNISLISIKKKQELTLEKALYYEYYIAKQERKLLSEFVAGELELLKKRDSENFLIENQDELIKVLQDEYLKLDQEQVKRKQTLKEIASQELSIKQTLTGYRAKALRFEIAFSSLLSNGQEQKKKEKKSFLANAVSAVGGKQHDQNLIGLQRRNYVFPVQNAKLIFEFGRRKIDNFRDIVYNKGAEFSAEPNAPVYVVSVGKVVFSGEMPGYSNVVIVDHGNRDYSLYGKLKQILVSRNESVSPESPIALLADSDNDESVMLYFEIRKNGRPVNPKTFIKNWPR